MTPHDPLIDWLLDDGPEPDADTLRDFREAPVPPELAERTLAAGLALMAQTPPAGRGLRLLRGGPRRALVAVGGLLAAAAAVMFTLPAPPQQGNVDGMTQRGLGVDLPTLDLRMAVRSQGGVDRLRADRSYGSGDVFYFRYEASADGWLHLLHATDSGIQVLESVAVTPGNADLARGGEPLAWTVDDSDPDRAVFALVRTALPVEATELADALQGALGSEPPTDPGSLCQAASALALSCDAQAVRVDR